MPGVQHADAARRIRIIATHRDDATDASRIDQREAEQRTRERLVRDDRRLHESEAVDQLA